VMINRELAIFLIVGSLTVLIDLIAYRGLVLLGVLDVEFSKSIGFLLGTLFAYFANRYWTFGEKRHATGSGFRFAVLYGVTLGANVLVNSFAMKLFDFTVANVYLSFLLATAVSATLNFFGMKEFVFAPTSEATLK
jgi:putative flippase GtrA